MSREKTRRERYENKKNTAKTYPISLVTINFKCDGNLAYLLRAAACFGAECVHVIGVLPPRSDLNAQSGSLYDYIEIKQHKTPCEFLDYAKDKEIRLISAELCENSKPISSYALGSHKHFAVVVGHEELGVPVEILQHSDKVYIPMPGVGFCLNTSQAANIMLYEMVNKYEYRQKQIEKWRNAECYHLT